MRAAVCTEFGPPEVFRLEEVTKPVPQNNEVLIRIHASPVTAIDTHYRRSTGNLFGAGKPRKKTIPGYYWSGEVEDVGQNVTQFKKGDRVFGGDVWSTGAYAEYKCVPEKKVRIIKPSSLTYEEATVLAYGGTTALPFLRDAGKIRKGQKVLVIGASGSIGTYAVQLAKYFGAEVTGVCSAAGLDLVKSLGASRVIDYTREDFTKIGQTWDIIFDTPPKSSFAACRGALTPSGRYLGTVPWPGLLLQMLWTSIASRKKAILRPMGLRSSRQKVLDLAFLQGLVEAEKVKPVIDRVFPLEQVVEAHRHAENGHKLGNIVIEIA
jgi:NADPH:quinone reductase-like Zn-dependent oxidoreductase